ncbi:cell division septum initiation protein DivIVA [Streptomyces sp. PvR006]|uniref:cellulose-binding protein n=1 Tax=Streptomyces sp. PvR006 TaxID=2817860 RepID=UPI001AE0FE8F|nr:cellulose-binding protein [Streptomyces sp. PvR006]MBP2582642.1 cell division septum initiation protein DivIVA [Streptomyces sp. PvR006]
MSFAVGRGRGYRPEQVDRHLAALSRDRDGAWERAARLTVLAKEMETEAARLRAAVEALVPHRYETLGDRAGKILELAELEDETLVRAAEAAAQSLAEAAEDAGREAAEAARAYAEGVRTAADAAAGATLATARARAEELTTEARREAEERLTGAREAFEETERRAADLLAEQDAEQKAVREEEDRTAEGRAAALDAHHGELTAAAEARLAEAQRSLAQTEEQARHGQEDAEARAGGLLAEARMRAERVERETERVLREHDEARDEIHGHMDHIRDSLAALTGRAGAAGEDEGEE